MITGPSLARTNYPEGEPELGGEEDGDGEDFGGPGFFPPALGDPELGGPELGGPELGGPDDGGDELGDTDEVGADVGPEEPIFSLAGEELGGPELGGEELGGAELGGPELGGDELGVDELGGDELGGAELGEGELGGGAPTEDPWLELELPAPLEELGEVLEGGCDAADPPPHAPGTAPPVEPVPAEPAPIELAPADPPPESTGELRSCRCTRPLITRLVIWSIATSSVAAPRDRAPPSCQSNVRTAAIFHTSVFKVSKAARAK